MTYYPTIEEDLARAKEILAKGKAEADNDDLPEAVRAWLAGQHGGTIYGADIYAAYKLLESFVAEIERLQVEHTRAALHYTFKGYMAGENTDAKHWRERAEKAEAEVADYRSSFELYNQASIALMHAYKAAHPEVPENVWPDATAVNVWAVAEIAKLQASLELTTSAAEDVIREQAVLIEQLRAEVTRLKGEIEQREVDAEWNAHNDS